MSESGRLGLRPAVPADLADLEILELKARPANAHCALYPRDSKEKRLLDAMLLAVPR